MQKVFLFDIDGTLTEPRQPMRADFELLFTEFAASRKCYLVSGCDYPKVCEQVPVAIRYLVDGIFTCAGAEIWLHDKRVYSEHHRFPAALISAFETLKDESPYPHRLGHHVEPRTGMLNVSVVGRNANHEQRLYYRVWDEEHGERQEIVTKLSADFPDYEFSIGGDISIDIAPRGGNKARILKHLDNWHPDAAYAFFGDKTKPGGNDWPIANALERRGPSNRVYAVDSYTLTQSYIARFVMSSDLAMKANQRPLNRTSDDFRMLDAYRNGLGKTGPARVPPTAK